MACPKGRLGLKKERRKKCTGGGGAVGGLLREGGCNYSHGGGGVSKRDNEPVNGSDERCWEAKQKSIANPRGTPGAEG